MDNYFVENLETGKIELHFERDAYTALTEDLKSEIKSAFLFSRSGACWVSRCKYPHLSHPRRVALSLGLDDGGTVNDRKSFAEQVNDKAERAERRAEKYEERAEHAAANGERLQKPVTDMHGDIAFFTQPNINTSSGRAFTSRRAKMFAAFEKGFKEYERSEYWKQRAGSARVTAAAKNLDDIGFVCRRIKERESDIRKIKSSIEEYETILSMIEKGEKPVDRHGWEVKAGADKLEKQVEAWLDLMEVKLDELGFYRSRLTELGGVKYSRENVQPGDTVEVKNFGKCEVVSCGPVNITFKPFAVPYCLTAAYAEITAHFPSKGISLDEFAEKHA